MSEPLIYKLWPKVALEIGPILKGQQNVQQGYSFRGVDDVFAKAHTPIFAAGLTVESTLRSWEARDYTRSRMRGNREEQQHFYQVFVDMRYTITAPDGSSIHADALGASIDYQDKAANQAMSQAIKMALIQMVLSPTGQLDPDAKAPHHAATADEPPEPEANPWDAVRDTAAALFDTAGITDAKTRNALWGEARATAADDPGKFIAELTSLVKDSGAGADTPAAVSTDELPPSAAGGPAPDHPAPTPEGGDTSPDRADLATEADGVGADTVGVGAARGEVAGPDPDVVREALAVLDAAENASQAKAALEPLITALGWTMRHVESVGGPPTGWPVDLRATGAAVKVQKVERELRQAAAEVLAPF